MNGRPGHSQDTESAKKAKMLSKKRQFHNVNFYNSENPFFQIALTLVSIAFVPENQHNFRTLFMSFSEKSWRVEKLAQKIKVCLVLPFKVSYETTSSSS